MWSQQDIKKKRQKKGKGQKNNVKTGKFQLLSHISPFSTCSCVRHQTPCRSRLHEKDQDQVSASRFPRVKGSWTAESCVRVCGAELSVSDRSARARHLHQAVLLPQYLKCGAARIARQTKPRLVPLSRLHDTCCSETTLVTSYSIWMYKRHSYFNDKKNFLVNFFCWHDGTPCDGCLVIMHIFNEF